MSRKFIILASLVLAVAVCNIVFWKLYWHPEIAKLRVHNRSVMPIKHFTVLSYLYNSDEKAGKLIAKMCTTQHSEALQPGEAFFVNFPCGKDRFSRKFKIIVNFSDGTTGRYEGIASDKWFATIMVSETKISGGFDALDD